MSQYTLAGNGALWVQPDGPNSQPQYLGCHSLSDITEPMGDVTLVYCPDPAIPNKFKVIGSYQSQATDGVTTSIETDVSSLADYLERINCPVPIFVHKVSNGRKNNFTAYDRSFVLKECRITQRSMTNMVAKDPESQERSTQSFDITAEELLRAFSMNTTRIPISEVEALNAIIALNDSQCAGDFGDAIDPGDYVFVGGDTLAGSTANTADVWRSLDGGSAWSLFQYDPFDGGEIISAIQYLNMGSGVIRILAACGTTGSGGAKIAFSDDWGATWTHVTLPTAVGEYITGPAGLFVLDYYNIWAVTTGGYVCKSSNGGSSFAVQSSADLTTEDLNAVHFSDENNGYAGGTNNAILSTSDGGEIWEAVTGHTDQSADGITDVRVHSAYRIWLSYDDGELYYSHDGGVTWNLRSHPKSGSGSIAAMDWLDDYVGIMVHNSDLSVGTVLMTIDGGYDWVSISTQTNLGLNDISIVDPSLAYAVGEVQGGTAVILKITGG